MPTAYSSALLSASRSLRLGAGQVLDEALGVLGLVGGGEHAGAGDAEEGARVLVAEVVQLGVVADEAVLGLVAVPVVVVRDADRDLALVDGLHDRGVARVDLGVAAPGR